jgi:hypothetical protein
MHGHQLVKPAKNSKGSVNGAAGRVTSEEATQNRPGIMFTGKGLTWTVLASIMSCDFDQSLRGLAVSPSRFQRVGSHQLFVGFAQVSKAR